MRSEEADHYIAKISSKKTPYFKTINKIKLKIDEGVYPTGKIGKLFYNAMSLPGIVLNNKKVLDYGTGTGFLAIIAAKKGAKVVGIDKNHIALNCAIYNAKKNNVQDQIDFRISNNLSSILTTEKFDLILAGLPWENALPNTLLEMAFYDQNFVMRKSLAEQATNLLMNKDSMILISYCKRVQNLIPIEKFFFNFDSKILLEKIINNDPHYIISLKIK